MSLVPRLSLFAAVLFSLCASAPAQDDWYKMGGTQPAGSRRTEANRAALTNQSILSLVEAELSDGSIVRKIQNSRCDFDISVEAIAEMKSRGVSNTILEAMINVSTPSPETPVSERASAPIGAKFYVAPMPDGFDGFISAEVMRRKLPIIIVDDERAADFIIAGGTTKGVHKWFDTVFGSGYERDRNQGNIKIIRVRDRTIVWAGEAGDRSLWWGAIKRGGQRKVADRLVGKMNSQFLKRSM